jgi:four helix bundle suffix protein
MSEIIQSHGNYQELESYQNSVVIFDATNNFCQWYLQKGDRTIDQMIQAARSGKQNIIEGCMASGISTETEIKLVGVARASLEELVEDYRDYLRTHNLPLWGKEDPRILQIRQLAKQKNKTYETYKSYLSADNPELFCNTMISLIHQTNYLLDRQIKSLEKSFTEKGGIRERMSRARKSYRVQQTEEVLSLLREIYRKLAEQGNQELMQKIEKAAKLLKERG